MTSAATTSGRHPHDDAPKTAQAFALLAGLPDGPERDALRDELAVAWLPMAHRLAVRFRNRGEQLDDLRQVAAVGLVKAIDRYDPTSGHAFESYAIPTITGEIKRHFRDRTWAMHVPRRVQDLRNRVRTAIRDLAPHSDGRHPTVADLAAHTGLTEEDVLLGMEALDSYRALSLDAQLTAESSSYSLGDTLGQADGRFEQVLRREAVRPHLEALPDRERRALYLRYFHDMTQSRIGDELGVSQMHVSRLLSGACDRIRRAVERDPRPGAGARARQRTAA